jgi:peptidyl-prolyl cis-trans isomerase D
VPDQSLADAAFAVSEAGGTSPVVDGQFGPVILRVSEISPESSKSFEEVEAEIREQLALAEAAQVLLDVHDAYEDARASGMTLPEAATQQKLTPVTDRGHRPQRPDAGGNSACATCRNRRQMLRDAFETETGVETPPINIGAEGFVWFEVNDVTPARDRTLEEVRERVVADWTAMKSLKRLAPRRRSSRSGSAQGAELSAIAEELAIAVETKYRAETRRCGRGVWRGGGGRPPSRARMVWSRSPTMLRATTGSCSR